MKLKLLFLCFTLGFISSFFSGCNEIEEFFGPSTETQDYIVVTVNAEVCVIDDFLQIPKADCPIDIRIIKAGGERFEGVPMTNSKGCTSAHATFNLYNKQEIVAKVYPTYYPELYQEQTLPWEVVKSGSVQKTYTWNPYFAFVI
jgi:hypothetical protein